MRQHAKFRADFSPASVAALDIVIDLSFGTQPAVPEGADFTPSQEQMQAIWNVGCYVGEVFRRLYGGVWREVINTNAYPYSAGVVMPPGDHSALSFMRVYKRLKYGNEQLLPWFDQIRMMIQRTRASLATQGRVCTPEEMFAPLKPGEGLPCAPNEPDEWVSFGNDLAAMDRTDDAIRFYERATRLAPRHPLAWSSLGCMLVDKQQMPRAHECWHKALEYADPNKDAELIGKVRGFLERIAQPGFAQPQVTLLEAISLVHEGSDGAAKALPTLDYFLAQKPESTVWWALKGDAHVSLKQFDAAQAAYRKVLELEPGDGPARRGLADCLLQLQRPDEALALVEEALRKDERDHPAWCVKGRVLRALGRREEALACLVKCSEIEAHYGAAWFERGFVEDELGRHEASVASWRRYGELARAPQHEEVFRIAERLAARCGAPAPQRGSAAGLPAEVPKQPANAGDRLEVVKTDVTASAEAVKLIDEATALGNQGRHADALAKLEEALRLAPRNPVVWTNKGNRLGRLGRWDEALACHETAVRYDPQFALGWSNKAFALIQLKRFQEAVGASDAALRANAGLAQGHVNKSMALLSLSRFPDALAAAEAGLRADPRSAPLAYNAAVAADKSYQQAKALQFYRRFVEFAPAGAAREIEFAKGRLKALGG
ncbi:MAG: tetratricopeptide repeat protein [Planctomycetota bacterium]|nr:tetratricopeptide repeat protein [Planctomycetota bacterium]